MRDVSAKVHTLRTATARAVIRVSSSSVQAMRDGTVPKGDPLPVARIAAIQAVKSTPQLIPYCHTVPIEHVSVEFAINDTEISIDVSVRSVYKTGVEMEAMAGAMVAALNVYDILKMIDDDMEVTSVRLIEKRGGKSDVKLKSDWSFGVIVVSDRVSQGVREDSSGLGLRQGLASLGGRERAFEVVPDEPSVVRAKVQLLCEQGLDLVVLTGGTGVSPRDLTPEALEGLFDKPLPGVVAQFQAYGQHRTPLAMLSRPQAGVVGQTVVLALPGSPSAVDDALKSLFPSLTHVFDILKGDGHA